MERQSKDVLINYGCHNYLFENLFPYPWNLFCFQLCFYLFENLFPYPWNLFCFQL